MQKISIKWRIVLAAALCFTLCQVVGAERLLIERFVVGDRILIDCIAYPDGGAVDVMTDETSVWFVAVMADGTVHETWSSMGRCKPDRVVARALGRAVHLVTYGAGCDVQHFRYWIPDGMQGLAERHQSFMPVIVND
jgi:hypothetical protein